MPPAESVPPPALEPRPDCPGPELIAAYAEGRPLWFRRRRLEAHFADCTRCFTLLMALREHLAADLGTETVPGIPPARFAGALPPFSKRPAPARLVWAGGGLAAAAAVALLIVMRGPGDPDLDTLRLALTDQRVTEARLSGFDYGASPAVLRSAKPSATRELSPEEQAAVADLQERALAATSRESEKPSAPGTPRTGDAAHALGMSRLIAGEADAGIADLRRAVAAEPDNARFRNDLAAAYLTRGIRNNDAGDLQHALDHATLASQRDGTLLEAWFNRALALEKLEDYERARAAWSDYLARDAKSPWADEARRRAPSP